MVRQYPKGEVWVKIIAMGARHWWKIVTLMIGIHIQLCVFISTYKMFVTIINKSMYSSDGFI